MDGFQQLLHDLRKQIDGVTNNVKTLKDNPVSMTPGVARAVAISITKLEESKMWLGKALGETGSELPKEFADKVDVANPGTTTAPSTPAEAGGQNAPAQPANGENNTPQQ